MAPTYTEEQREGFALGLLRFPDDPFRAAMQVCRQPADALRMSQALAEDTDIQNRMARLLDEYGDEAFLPTLAETARAAYSLAVDFSQSATVAERANALRLYAELRGFIAGKGAAAGQKAGNAGQLPNSGGGAPLLPAGGVMQVPVFGANSDWEAAVRAQQKRLMDEVSGGR